MCGRGGENDVYVLLCKDESCKLLYIKIFYGIVWARGHEKGFLNIIVCEGVAHLDRESEVCVRRKERENKKVG